MKISFHFLWYDCYFGWYYDRKKRILYLVPFFMCVIKIVLKEKPREPLLPNAPCEICGHDFSPFVYCPIDHRPFLEKKDA